MYRRILVPVDGSPASMAGLTQALGIAKGARVRVINVVDDLIVAPALMDTAMPADVSFILDSLREEGRKALAQAAALAKRRGVKAEMVQIESGARTVSDAILAEARRWRADLLVMGTHGRRGLNRLLLGSDAERVLHETPVPVLLARLAPAGPSVPKRRGRGR